MVLRSFVCSAIKIFPVNGPTMQTSFYRPSFAKTSLSSIFFQHTQVAVLNSSLITYIEDPFVVGEVRQSFDWLFDRKRQLTRCPVRYNNRVSIGNTATIASGQNLSLIM